MADIQHEDILDPKIHEPKGVAAALSGQVYTANGAGSGSWTTPVSLFDPADILIEEVLSAKSIAANQQPTAVDTPIQIEIGPAQKTGADPVMLAVDGTITFNQAGTYRIDASAHYGRTGGAGVSHLFTRQLINGTAVGTPLTARLDDADVLLPFSFENWFTVPAATTLTFELLRDSAGDNSGGLFQQTPSLAGWAASPSFSLTVSRLIK